MLYWSCTMTATRPGSVGFVGRAHAHGQQRALAVHGHVVRAALDLLTAMEAAFLAFGGTLDALTIQDGVARGTPAAAQLHFPPAGSPIARRSGRSDMALPASGAERRVAVAMAPWERRHPNRSSVTRIKTGCRPVPILPPPPTLCCSLVDVGDLKNLLQIFPGFIQV